MSELVQIIFALMLFVLGIIVLGLAIVSKHSKSVWFCDKMGWHQRPRAQGFDGCSFTGVCPRCNKHVMQDSQGNWF